MRALLWKIQSQFRDRWKVRRYPSQHYNYFKTRRGAVKFCVNGYNGWGGDWELYKLYKTGHTKRIPWF